jgi:hypothetical protein
MSKYSGSCHWANGTWQLHAKIAQWHIASFLLEWSPDLAIAFTTADLRCHPFSCQHTYFPTLQDLTPKKNSWESIKFPGGFWWPPSGKDFPSPKQKHKKRNPPISLECSATPHFPTFHLVTMTHRVAKGTNHPPDWHRLLYTENTWAEQLRKESSPNFSRNRAFWEFSNQ